MLRHINLQLRGVHCCQHLRSIGGLRTPSYSWTSIQSNTDRYVHTRLLATQSHEPDSKGRLVYEGTVSGTVKGVKAFSLFTSILGVGIQPYVWSHVGSEIQNKLLVVSVFGFSILCMPLLLHFITKKYVTKIYWNEQEGMFTAETISLFLRKKSLTFSADESDMAEMSGMFTSFKAKGRAFFVDGNSFTDQEAYIALMGLDRPFEWEIEAKKEFEDELDTKKKLEDELKKTN